MPLRIRWKSDEYLPIGLMLLGACGLFQLLFVFIAQYALHIGDYLIIIVIPLAITGALFYSCKILFESYAQVKRRKNLKNQFRKKKEIKSKFKRFLAFPVSKPLIITCSIFTGVFIATYAIFIVFSDVLISFLIAENVSAITCLIIADFIEKNYAKIRKF
ncbi:MAG: hypothetical protein ACFFAS_18950 [Promethearchaeota archaeon]